MKSLPVATLSLQMLTFYELDLGLNHVVRKWSEPTDPRANMLVQGPYHPFFSFLHSRIQDQDD